MWSTCLFQGWGGEKGDKKGIDRWGIRSAGAGRNRWDEMQWGPTSGSRCGKTQVRKRDKRFKEGSERQRFVLVWSQGKIKGRRVTQRECYCLKLNVSKATMTTPSETWGCLRIWHVLQPGVPALRCQGENENGWWWKTSGRPLVRWLIQWGLNKETDEGQAKRGIKGLRGIANGSSWIALKSPMVLRRLWKLEPS